MLGNPPRSGLLKVFQALYEHKLTLAEALKLLEFPNHAFRATLAQGIKDEATRGTLEELNALRSLDYHMQISCSRTRPTTTRRENGAQ